MEKALFAGGCFWGIQEAFSKTKGVLNTKAGYSGGKRANPTYEQVCSGATGHTESVLVEFDSAVVAYENLLQIFWGLIDPTTVNRQGFDVGSQYRSAIFVFDDSQNNIAVESKQRYQQKLKRPIVTEIIPVQDFYEAEGYHQHYLENKKTGLI